MASSSSSSTIRMTGLISGLDTESIVSGLMSAQRYKATKIENKITKLQWKQEIWKALNTKIYSFYTGSLQKLRMQGSFNTKTATSSDEGNVTVTAGSNATDGTQTLQISKLAKAQSVTGAVLSTSASTSTTLQSLGVIASGGSGTITITGTSEQKLNIDSTTTVANFITTCKNAGLNANFDATQQRFFISSKNSGSTNMFSITSSGATISKLGLSDITTSGGTPVATDTSVGMNLITPQNASFVYNGVTMSSSSNTVSVNGLTLNLKSVTDTGETVNINVGKDVDSIYKMIKTCLSEYNDILDAMNTDYDADSTTGYEPLTDDQKESMSDSEIEKWETKIKDSLLRRDDNLETIISAFRTNLSGSIKVNNKSYSLASFGITSYNYTEKGKLHIEGDPDDSLTSGDDDKLKAALENDPDTVAAVFNGLADKLYTALQKDMRSTPLRSALTLYNDKEMSNQIDDYQDELDDLNDKLDDMEDRYYKQFSEMETQLAKMNSQSSSLSSMLGTSS